MAQDLTALTEQVRVTTEVSTSAIALINGLAAQIEALQDDPAALAGLVEDLRANAAALGAAVAANT